MTQNRAELVSVAIQTALQAGALLRKGFNTAFEIQEKEGRHNLVTAYDREAEALIFSSLLKRFPHHGFLGEETGYVRKGEITWIVDPLDGTVNFAHGIPIFAVSIAAATATEILCSSVYQPITQELFWAEKGKGAFLNGQPLKASSHAHVDQTLMATGFPYNVEEDPLHCIETFTKMVRQGIPIRRLGSAAIDLAYVAAGRFDVYWEVSLQPWDLAGGKLLVEEAGGKVTRYDGSPCALFSTNPVLATNNLLHASLIEVLSS